MDSTTARLLSDFGYCLKIERQMSPNTVDAYVSDCEAFFASCGASPKDVTTEDIEEYLASRSDDLSKRSQARELSALRSFFDYLLMENERPDNPCDNVSAPKLGRYLPSVLSVEEVDAIMDSVQGSSPSALRDRAILEILYGCGLRVSELCGLLISHVYVDEGFVRVIGKGSKERLVPLGEMAAEAFTAWLEVRGEPREPKYSDIVFLNRFGAPLSRVAVFNLVKKQALLAGVNKEISPHTFRHSFATHMIENGADLRIVQEMLGHESILTTEIYTHIDQATWQEAVLSHHPRNREDQQ